MCTHKIRTRETQTEILMTFINQSNLDSHQFKFLMDDQTHLLIFRNWIAQNIAFQCVTSILIRLLLLRMMFTYK